MAQEQPRYQTPIIPREQFYANFRIGKSHITKRGNMNIPKQVMMNYSLRKGDILEWYPCGVEFPDPFEKDVIAILIVRREKTEKKKVEIPVNDQ